jgi:hypothetical protein
VNAGGSATWASVHPILDGAASASEWGAAQLLSFIHFQVRYENDAQFLYVLIDVTAETSNNTIAQNSDGFTISLDVDQNGTYEILYYLAYSAPNPLLRSDYLGGGVYTGGYAAVSYGAYGFGPSLSTTTPHRIYELAIRLSEIHAKLGHPINAVFFGLIFKSSLHRNYLNVGSGRRLVAGGIYLQHRRRVDRCPGLPDLAV